MKISLIAACATALALPGVAMAQSGNATTAPTNQATGQMSGQGSNKMSGDRQGADHLITARKLEQDLKSAGFTDVKIVAEAYVVQAKTKDGDPVVMTLGPHGFTAFQAVDATGSTGRGADGKMDGRMATAGTQSLAVSKLKGMNLYNANGNMLGDVEHVVSDGQGRDSIVIGNGGFLGMGEKQVAISLANVQVKGDRLVTHQLTDDQIKSMPEWKKGQQTDLDGNKTVQVRTGG